MQILPSWGDTNLLLQDETNESRFKQLARLLPSWLDRHCPRKLLPTGAKEPDRKWLELCCLGQKLRDERNSESHWRNPTYNLQRTLVASQKRQHLNTGNEKGIWSEESTTDNILHCPLSPNPSRSKSEQNMGQGEWKNRPYSSSSPVNPSVNPKSDRSWKKTKPVNWASKQSFYISGRDFWFLFYFFK